MKTLIALLVLMSGCAEVTPAIRPNITETTLPNGRTRIDVENPYRWKMQARLDCAGERDMRKVEIKAGEKVSFVLETAEHYACTSERL